MSLCLGFDKALAQWAELLEPLGSGFFPCQVTIFVSPSISHRVSSSFSSGRRPLPIPYACTWNFSKGCFAIRQVGLFSWKRLLRRIWAIPTQLDLIRCKNVMSSDSLNNNIKPVCCNGFHLVNSKMNGPKHSNWPLACWNIETGSPTGWECHLHCPNSYKWNK